MFLVLFFQLSTPFRLKCIDYLCKTTTWKRDSFLHYIERVSSYKTLLQATAATFLFPIFFQDLKKAAFYRFGLTVSRSPKLSNNESADKYTLFADAETVAAISRAASILRRVKKAGFCWTAAPIRVAD
jgi:hypothetical protein